MKVTADIALPKNVYLINHAQVYFNIRDILRGSREPGLDETGCRQARRMALFFKDKDITRIVSAPHRPTMQTAEYFASMLHLSVTLNQDMRDRDDAYRLYFDSSNPSQKEHAGNRYKPEAQATFERRIMLGMESIVTSSRPGQSVVVVLNKSVIQRIIARWFSGRFTSVSAIPQDPACWNMIGIDRADSRKLLVLNGKPFLKIDVNQGH